MGVGFLADASAARHSRLQATLFVLHSGTTVTCCKQVRRKVTFSYKIHFLRGILVACTVATLIYTRQRRWRRHRISFVD